MAREFWICIPIVINTVTASVGWAYGLIMNLSVTIRFPPEYKETPE